MLAQRGTQSHAGHLKVGILEKLTEVEQMLTNNQGKVTHSMYLVGS